ncbi:MAG TPA: prolipoprotein diacylglyceryl transferase, partial [Deltaproteobacteria bacterium]|nr:prolipoprotein diacylglyceryl transferase [Deltaproteobacteria bacterium]
MNEIIQAWQHLPVSLDPVLASIGSFQIRYYSLMYLAAFFCTYLLVVRRTRTEHYEFSTIVIQDVFVWAIVGLLVGARLGYVLFYDMSYFIEHPLEVFLPVRWSDDGVFFTGIRGLSYHGGLLGITAAVVVFCRRRGIRVLRLADLFAAAVPLGYTFGRLGNFINGELYGKVTSVPWGMYFPLDPTRRLRHPSQLYEALFEGLVLFALLWPLRKKFRTEGTLFGLYIAGYGTIRFVIEFFREPDLHLG